MKVAIIGAGPSGLVTLKYLAEAHEYLGCEPVEARLFEYQPQVGGTFAARVYEDAELVSSKQLTTFSDFRVPNGGDFLSATRYVEYLKDYCTQFGLWRHIRLSTRVLSVKRRSPGHTVVYEHGGEHTEWACDAVAVCSGLHVEPNMPLIPGLENVPRVIHSSQFKARKQFHDARTVMVVGSGETGADISHLAVTTPRVERVLLCHRDGVHFAPKKSRPCDSPGPSETESRGAGYPDRRQQGEHVRYCVVHRILRQNDALLWGYYNVYIKCLLFISSGTTLGMDQWIGGISPERHHPSKIFFNKSMKVCPYISQPYRPQIPGPRLWLYALRSALVQTPIPDTQGRRVDLAPWPQCIDARGNVKFVDNGRLEYERLRDQEIRPDMIVLCTGYKQSFPFLNNDNDGNKSDLPYPTPDCADVRQVWRRDDPSVGFIGFVRPSLGAIPPLAELQAQLWISHLLAPHRIPRPLVPEDESHYKLRAMPGARITYGVDHESYAYQLALDTGSAPGLWDMIGLLSWRRLAQSLKLIIIWIFGANINTRFRLQGPWKWDGAVSLLASDEIWHTITRRPILFGIHSSFQFKPRVHHELLNTS
ncbi:hypothetical protein C2857_004426 [Epichloe festucae Fl1]|uniref:Dimethylaniline monooxygenase n=1 Tax=Epichloe festucae (strain Fl1) TaxID=877507 RepID=A0A7S9KPG4_EPIFF|nr:hypothetical protein C2857_004426 [Epichloe festucae Fl1]